MFSFFGRKRNTTTPTNSGTRTTKTGNTNTGLQSGAKVVRTPDGATHFSYTRKNGERVTVRRPGKNG